MSFFNNLFKNITFQRDKAGNYSYFSNSSAFGNSKDFLTWSLENPILFSVVATRSKAFSQMQVVCKNEKGEIVDVPELELVNNPNPLQTRQDFLYQYMWFMSVAGENYMYKIQPLSTQIPKSIYNLQPNCLDFTNLDNFDPFIFRKKEVKDLQDKTVNYNINGETKRFRFGDLEGFFDIANGLSDARSYFNSPSRIKSIEGVLCNIDENIKSKNLNLKFSQKYLFTNKNNVQGVATQLQKEDRQSIENTLFGKSIQITNADVQASHLISDMKRLYLDEQFATDGNTVALAFEMNKDIMNYFLGKSSTYENQEQGIIRYIQNSIQSSADQLMDGLTNILKLNERGLYLQASYDHLPVMQSVLNTKLKTLSESQEAIKTALENGTMTEDEAIDLTKNVIEKIGL